MTLHDVDEAVSAFVEATKLHYQATLAGNYKITNKYAQIIDEAFRKIVAMGVEARQALLANVDDDDNAVASMAAVYSLKFNPERALDALRRIADKPGLIGFGAQQAIQRWEEGTWQLE